MVKIDINCKKRVKLGMKFRTISTILFYFIIFSYKHKDFINKYLYIILPIGLMVLDTMDNFLNKMKYKYLFDVCSQTFEYQRNDKIIDTLSYLPLLLLIDNPIIPVFLLYRMIGVLSLLDNKQGKYLILFPDYMKEFTLYLYFFNNNYTHLNKLLLGKLIFEFLLHHINNKHTYNTNDYIITIDKLKNN